MTVAKSDLRFLGVRLVDFSSRDEVMAALFSLSKSRTYGWLVTPNADHVVKLGEADRGALRVIYENAVLSICDSRVLARLAALVGLKPFTYPGSDIVRDLLLRPEARDHVIGIVGPSEADFMALAGLLPEAQLSFFHSPSRMEVGSPAFQQCAQSVAEGHWDVLLVCFGFPKQEFFVAALSNWGRQTGLALCVGASIDFLVGKQKRAPLILQKLSLEWMFRLISSPRRLWRRYILGMPALLSLFIKVELWPRLKGRTTP